MASHRLRAREAAAGYLFLTPNLLGFLIFSAFPVVASLLLSFADWDLITAPQAAGVSNYTRLVDDPVFWKSLYNTLYYTVGSVPLTIGLGLLLALALNGKTRGLYGYRAAFFLPVVASSVSVALIWQWLLDRDIGLINYVLSLVGIEPIPWLTSTRWAMPSVIMVAVWKNLGYNMVILLAALQEVPRELYEAAVVDGATPWQAVRRITIPLITPSIFFVTVTSIIGSFQVFELTSVLTRGGPANATNTLVMFIYQYAFQSFQMGYASAAAYALFAIILAVTAVQFATSKRWVYQQ
ncbi:MAG TPA: sugar ABC transporter permease [Limnochordales bacterium]